MRLGVIGTGYVGLVTGTCFSDLGVHVTCVDSDKAKIEALESGKMPFYEPGLKQLVEKNIAQGRLDFTTDLATVVEESLVLMIAVGTPMSDDGTADLSQVEAVADVIGEHLNGYKVIVTKSTVPTGTGARIKKILEDKVQGGHSFDVCSNPEFLREGSAIEDFLQGDRVVVGAESEQALAILRDLYRPLTRRNMPLLETNVETSEMIKYASNAFLATKVSFINEVSALCEQVGADVVQVAQGMGLDQRIGKHFLRPGPGYGGSCFPKDTSAFALIGRQNKAPLQIVEATIAANDLQIERCRDKLVNALGDSPESKTIGVLGLAFKPDTDDLRDSPTIPILKHVQGLGTRIQAYDPEAMENARTKLPDLHYCKGVEEALEGADIAVIFTEWNQFRAIDWENLSKKMKGKKVIDYRNLYAPSKMAARGLEYQCVGRPVRPA